MQNSTLAYIAAFALFIIAIVAGITGHTEGHSESNRLGFIMLSAALICKAIEDNERI